MIHGIQIVMDNGYGRRVACQTLVKIEQMCGVQHTSLAPSLRYYLEKKDEPGQFRCASRNNIHRRVRQELNACIVAEVERLSNHYWG